MSDSGAVALAQGIEKCPQLRELYLGNNQISDSGAVALAALRRAFGPQKQAVNIYIDGNPVSRLGLVAWDGCGRPIQPYASSVGDSSKRARVLKASRGLLPMRVFIMAGMRDPSPEVNLRSMIQDFRRHVALRLFSEPPRPHGTMSLAEFLRCDGDNAIMHEVAEFLWDGGEDEDVDHEEDDGAAE